MMFLARAKWGVGVALAGMVLGIVGAGAVHDARAADAATASAPATQDGGALTLKPGVGVGALRFGDSPDEITRVLGRPESITSDVSWNYPSKGLAIVVFPKLGLTSVQARGQKATPALKLKDFRGKTDAGLGIGSSREQVEAAYGKASRSDKIGADTVMLYYDKDYVWFMLQAERVIEIDLEPPPGVLRAAGGKSESVEDRGSRRAAATRAARTVSTQPMAVPATQPTVWVALLVRSPLRSIADYHTVLCTDPAAAPPLYKRVGIPDCELEFRRARDQARLVRVPRREYLRETKIGQRVRDWNFLDEDDRRRVGVLADGEYLVALCIGEMRISNVAAFRIDSKFDRTREPALRAIPIEPGPGRESRYLGLRGIAPGADGPAGFDAAFYFPDLVLDGNKIVRPGPAVFIGPGPMPAGQQCEAIIDLRLYVAEGALGKPHAIGAGSGKFQSDQVQLAVKQELGGAWDDATVKIKPPPEPPVMLGGQVVGNDGKPARGYEVTLGNDAEEALETETDEEGRFSFVHIPAGKYRLSCNPLQMGSPQLTIKDIAIPVKEPQHRDLVMTAQCTLAGNVSTAEGKPAAKVEVDLVVVTAPGAEFHATAQTDGQGRYELACPLGVVDYLGIKGQRVRGKMPVLKAGENQADYVLRESTARRSPAARVEVGTAVVTVERII